jgi:energy-coupling factor transporter ATP-binding protein EcfA2
MSEIRSITIRRFKALREVTFSLDEATVFVGGNNSGKSSILQALHFAIAVAQSAKLVRPDAWRDNTYDITFRPEQLIYSPTTDFTALGHDRPLAERRDTWIEVEITVDPAQRCIIAVGRGRNGNISVHLEGRELGVRIQDISRPYTIYAPGLAGVAREETVLAQGVIRRIVARGDANLVLRNVLLWLFNRTKDDDETRDEGNDWEQFQNDIRELFPGLALRVAFSDLTDEHIHVTFRLANDLWLPIDCAGTGILQATQVLAYINLFKPRLLLLDEPDSHMHPNNQAAICKLLLRLAREREFQVIVASHSRHVFSAMREEAEVRWVAHGSVVEGVPTEATARLLELGALDSLDFLGHPDLRCAFLTEDSNTPLLESVLASSGFNIEQTQILPYNGCTKIDAVLALAALLRDRAPNVRVIVHRDRDYLPAADLDSYTQQITAHGCTAFITDTSDLEGHFLNAEHVHSLYPQINVQRANELLQEATVAARDASIRDIINLRTDHAWRRRARGEDNPNVGEIALAAHREYEANPGLMRRGKRVFAQLRQLLQRELGAHARLDAQSPALASEPLSILAAEIWGAMDAHDRR